MFYIYLGSKLLFQTGMEVGIQFVILTIFTFAGSMVTYEFIRRIKFLKPLFGLRYETKTHVKFDFLKTNKHDPSENRKADIPAMDT